jgi:serine/threonine protein kinase
MLTGRLPHEADDPIATAMKHLERPPPHPREANPAVPAELDALTVRLLAKDPHDRYPGGAPSWPRTSGEYATGSCPWPLRPGSEPALTRLWSHRREGHLVQEAVRRDG